VSDSYLLDYLMQASAPANVVDQLTEQQAQILEDARLLTVKYSQTRPKYELLDSYYRGYPPLPTAPVRLTSQYRALLAMSRSNWCGLVVDVVDERLRVDSIVSTDAPVKDELVWSWWEANNMALHSSEVHSATLEFGLCYVSCWPAISPGGAPRILGESPLATYVECDANTQAPLTAIRIWFNPIDQKMYADYTTPEYQFHLTTTAAVGHKLYSWSDYSVTSFQLETVQWTYREDVPPVSVIAGGRLPYVVFRNRPTLTGECHSEIEGILPIQDRINKTTFDRLVTQEFAAFPQRWVTGIDIPEDPGTGKPIQPFNAAVDRVWTLANEQGKFGQFDQASADGYLKANVADVQALATQSRTPPHYLVAGMGVFPSGESVRATEYGLTRKVENHKLAFGDPWGDVLRMACFIAGEFDKSEDPRLGVHWQDVEAHSEAEVADAILKLSGIPGVPIEPLLQRAGIDPSTFDAYRQRAGNVTPPVTEQVPVEPTPQ
jgi:hypothetical protein